VLRLSGFADEISPDLDEQIRVCKMNQVTHFELRGVEGKNVLDFDQGLRRKIKDKLDAAGLGVISIGSPIGKIKITDPWAPHFEQFKTAVELAEFFNAPLIRVFSYYPDEQNDILGHREEVMRRMKAKVEYVKDHPVTLVHENEARIYGEKGKQCVDLMKTIDSPKLRSAFDFANFVHAGENPKDNWPALKPYTVHIHIKDMKFNGPVVPAGEGDGEVGPILADAYKSGYRGFLSLEPHLSQAGQFSGFSGPDLFTKAVDALKKVCREYQVPLAG
jgi:sugar phosphate isomerase/epimerase